MKAKTEKRRQNWEETPAGESRREGEGRQSKRGRRNLYKREGASAKVKGEKEEQKERKGNVGNQKNLQKPKRDEREWKKNNGAAQKNPSTFFWKIVFLRKEIVLGLLIVASVKGLQPYESDRFTHIVRPPE